ncbi:hypothetical protein [Caenispirillum bisanense]|uniref:Uncharacterized protein n=1 Tax=Caenispirillum bisanense TaxID=414052 RepID=A0A286GNU6_9PROT|nr:hypothetical protein [Caenispirillum bisanense]SOD97213.1 hypothetical protein SAMN05421508_106334 [Caenispirillum bisanense]
MPKNMTVGDLRAALAKFTDDIPVCVSLWEGTGGTEYAEIAIVEYFRRRQLERQALRRVHQSVGR